MSLSNTLRFICFNIRLQGKKSITCQANGNWSAEVPYCKAVECKNEIDLKNGIITSVCIFI